MPLEIEHGMERRSKASSRARKVVSRSIKGAPVCLSAPCPGGARREYGLGASLKRINLTFEDNPFRRVENEVHPELETAIKEFRRHDALGST